ncbi:uncharacterized protein [Montipora capricornis]|uniref:uncharacterized protein n=1 Tax=Montipora capricornis TaxID=246305 RepID=UPI0035F16551
MASFQKPLPKFNLFSFDVERFSQDKLLVPQREALESLQRFFGGQNEGRIGLVSMPTGSGKTGVISCLPFFLGKLGLQEPPVRGAPPYGEPLHKFDKPVLVIAPDLEIADQLKERLTVSANASGENFLRKTKIIPPNALYALPVGHKIEETKHVGNPEFLQSKDVIIANAQKFLKDEWEEVLPEDIFKLVIVDEAHHHPSKTWRRIIRKFRNHAMVVFFTATPYRGDGRLVLEETEGELVFHLSLKDAREQRIIRRINWTRLSVGETEDDRFTLILEKVKSIQEAKDLKNPLPDGIPHMAIAITKNIAYAEQVADLWNDTWGNHGSAIAYHSDVRPKSLKKVMMEAIKTNQVKLVVVVESLLEGFDHPPISIAAIMTKIVSPVKFAQFIGRAQRVVRGHEGLEAAEISADIVFHKFFQQEENIQAFEQERLIPAD